MSDLPAKVEVRTKAQAEELLSKYTLEQVRSMWENGAFHHPLPPDVKDYFTRRLILGEL